MTADFLANDFAAIARAMRRETPPPQAAVLHFWDLSNFLTSEHENVEVAVAEAYAFVVSDTGIPVRITTPSGTMLMDTAALAEAVIRYGEGMPT
ncbi:hypothetical protein E2C06_35220 [Dankookia rubra]|uniref:Uncharacterized protein n=1 Tax=Dankookia rubra TaxID=1442381 RepID=A0A4R5Q4T2_9PROT|nr:hypothetical protein [Dankookia rubra]TDH57940.1 hypothetical protein E2C06_35220 [Dankookia rubra]